MEVGFIQFLKKSKKEILIIFSAFIFTRIVFAATLYIGYYFLPKGSDVYPNIHRALDIIFQFNDASIYPYIAENGYEGYHYAFAPLFPIAIKILSPIFKDSYALSGFFISNIAFIFVLILLFYYFCIYIGKKASMYGTLALIVYPASHYNSIGYTESIFLLLTLISILAYRKEDYMLSSLFCGLSILTRIAGFALLAGYGLDMLVSFIKNKDFSVKSVLSLLKNGLSFLAIVIAIYGLWLIFMYAKTSNAFYFLEAQKTWSREMPNFFILPFIIRLTIRVFTYPALRTLLELILPLTMLWLSIASFKKFPVYFWFYSTMTIIIPLTTQSAWSLTRLPMVALAAYGFVGIKSEKNKVFKAIWFSVSFILYVIFTSTMGQLRATFI